MAKVLVWLQKLKFQGPWTKEHLAHTAPSFLGKPPSHSAPGDKQHRCSQRNPQLLQRLCLKTAFICWISLLQMRHFPSPWSTGSSLQLWPGSFLCPLPRVTTVVSTSGSPGTTAPLHRLFSTRPNWQRLRPRAGVPKLGPCQRKLGSWVFSGAGEEGEGLLSLLSQV